MPTTQTVPHGTMPIVCVPVRNTTLPFTGCVRPAVRPKIQCEVDIAFTIDTTDSSVAFRTGIPLACEQMLKAVEAKAAHIRVWVQSHGDLDCGQNMVLHTDAGTVGQALADIGRLHFAGGGDPDEHHLDAIEHLLNTVPWQADPTRGRGAIVAFLTADTKPTKSGTTATALGQEICRRGIFLYLICQPTPTLYELAKAAGGLMFEISNAPDPLSLQQVAMQVSASIAMPSDGGHTTPMPAPGPRTP